MADEDLQNEVLEDLRHAPNYKRWLAGMARPYLGVHALELGSGLGDYAEQWLTWGVPRIDLIESDPHRMTFLERRFAGNHRVDVRQSIDDVDSGAKFSSFVSFNVLEHVNQPVEILKAAIPYLTPRAPVLTFVPAFPSLMSDFDLKIGHVRRYTKESLAADLSAAGLVIERLRYVNLPGLFAWALGMKALKLTPSDGPLLSLWDQTVIPLTRRVERAYSVPFGQSLWGVARVPVSW